MAQPHDHTFGLSVCIPTARRPEMVARLLQNLSQQTRLPDEVLVVDASPDEETAKVVMACESLFPPGVLQRLASPLGVILQRSLGLDHTTGELVCMVDDDVLLEPDCLEALEAFLMSPDGARFGGVGPYITNGYGKSFSKHERCYHRLGIYESLRPGAWLYCGDFISLSRLQPFVGVHETQYLVGCTILWRRAVFEHTDPRAGLEYSGEDRHLSVRVGRRWALGIVGRARIRHDRWQGGVRPRPFVQGLRTMRNRAIILRECDPRPSWRRYLAHQAYQWLDLWRLTLSHIVAGNWLGLQRAAGSWAGWLWNVLPPSRCMDH